MIDPEELKVPFLIVLIPNYFETKDELDSSSCILHFVKGSELYYFIPDFNLTIKVVIWDHLS